MSPIAGRDEERATRRLASTRAPPALASRLVLPLPYRNRIDPRSFNHR
jgi:hypothetical protein